MCMWLVKTQYKLLSQALIINIIYYMDVDVISAVTTGYVIKQLVHAFSCALSSYGALGKFGEHSQKQVSSFV